VCLLVCLIVGVYDCWLAWFRVGVFDGVWGCVHAELPDCVLVWLIAGLATCWLA